MNHPMMAYPPAPAVHVAPPMAKRGPKQLAAQLATEGFAVTTLPAGSVEPARAMFEHIAPYVLEADDQCIEFIAPEDIASLREAGGDPCLRWGPKHMPWPDPAESSLGVHVGDQSGTKDGDKGVDYLTFVNPTNRATFERMAAPFRGVLEEVCRELFGKDERIVTISSTYVVGTEKLDPAVHVDFRTRNIITLLFPLYQYRSCDAGLFYWRFDENPELYPEGVPVGQLEQVPYDTCPRLYNYRLGEGVLFSGALYHQTMPFTTPPGGWGRARCRVLLGVMAAAVDALLAEDLYPDPVIAMASAANGYYISPETGEWLTPLPSFRILAWQWLAAQVRQGTRGLTDLFN